MKKLLAGTTIALALATAPALAQQAGSNGRCDRVGRQTIVWGGFSPEIAGADGYDWPVTISAPSAGVIKIIPNSQHYYQFPYTCAAAGFITWTSAAPPVNAASITGQALPPVGAYPPPGYTPLPKGYGPSAADKDGYQTYAAFYALTAAGLSILVVAAAPAAVVGAASLGVAAFLGLSFSMQVMAADPPDPHYTLIASPAAETPVIPAPAGTPACYQTFLNRVATATGFIDAMKITINRISGAAAAKDSTWLAKQQSWFLQLQAQLPGVQLTLQRATWSWAANCAPKHAPISSATVLGAERRWLKYGLPTPISDALLQMGVNNYDAWQALFPAAPTAVANMVNGGFR